MRSNHPGYDTSSPSIISHKTMGEIEGGLYLPDFISVNMTAAVQKLGQERNMNHEGVQGNCPVVNLLVPAPCWGTKSTQGYAGSCGLCLPQASVQLSWVPLRQAHWEELQDGWGVGASLVRAQALGGL